MSTTHNTESISLTNRSTHRLATCWKIVRTDGKPYTFTDHDQILLFPEPGDATRTNIVWEPTGGFDVSAHRQETGLRAENVEFAGAITSAKISDKDLYAGKFRNAKVNEYMVDWRYPWMGSLKQATYWIGETTFTGNVWEVEVLGLNQFLQNPLGPFYTRNCRHILGLGGCATVRGTARGKGVDLTTGVASLTGDAYTLTNVNVDTVTSREVFTIQIGDIAANTPDDWYNGGEIAWTFPVDDNQATLSEIKKFVASTRTITLRHPTVADIDVTAKFTLIIGCQFTREDCGTKFQNEENFGGQPYIPGPKRARQGPKE